jgi:hypothetical protein
MPFVRKPLTEFGLKVYFQTTFKSGILANQQNLVPKQLVDIQ